MAGTVNERYTWTPTVQIGTALVNDARILVWDNDGDIEVNGLKTGPNISAAISEDNAVFTNETTDANSDTANDVTLMPTPAASTDRFYFGFSSPFDSMAINVGTAGAGTYTLDWEYYDGSAWVSIEVDDASGDFKNSGWRIVSWTKPGNWVANTVNTQGPFYYIRCTRDAGTQTTQPLGTRIRILPGKIAEQNLFQARYSVASGPIVTPNEETPQVVRTIYYGDTNLGGGAYACRINEFNKDLGRTGSLNTIFLTVDPYVTSTKTVANGWTDITFNHTADSITLTSNRTILQVYMRGIDEQYDAVEGDIEGVTGFLITGDGLNFNVYYDLIVNTGVTLTSANQKLFMDGTKDITFNGTGTFAGTFAVDGDINWGTDLTVSDLTVTNGAFDFTTAGTYTFTNCTIDEVTNSSGGSVTINAVNTTITTNTGPNITIILNPVSLTVTVTDEGTGSPIQYAAVTLPVSDALGDYPYQESVTITRSGGTATVAHTGHGLSTGQKVIIDGADQNEYNRIKTITVTGVNEYTYPVSGSPTTPATGTITSTAVLIDGETDASGQIVDTRTYPTANQNFAGQVQQGTRQPIYKGRPVSGTVNKDSGTAVSVLLTRD